MVKLIISFIFTLKELILIKFYFEGICVKKNFRLIHELEVEECTHETCKSAKVGRM